jgi:chromosome partitioning protein
MADEMGGHVVARRIGIVNEKGGSCKTTLAVHLGAYLAGEKRKRVLLIDCDPQGHLGKTLGYDVNAYSRTTLEMLLDEERNPALFVRRTRFKGLEVVLSNKSIAIFPTVTAADPQRHLRLRRALDRLPGYDFILIDSPASFGTLMLGIFAAAEELVVPVNASFLALDGCAELTRTLATLPSSPGISAPDLRLIVPTLYRPTRMADAVLERLRAHFPGRVFPDPLRYDVKVEEAQSHGRTIWEYAPRSRAGVMLADLGHHLFTMGAPPGRAPVAEGARAPEADEEAVATDFRRKA